MNEIYSTILILGVAALLGGAIGVERELHGGAAGLRTHMLVAMAAAMFVVIGMDAADASSADLSRIIQGIAAGIGFIGAGTILKLTGRLEIKGLTTASSIWLAAAVGTACGVKDFTLALVAAVMSLVILYLFAKLERLFPSRFKHEPLLPPHEVEGDQPDPATGVPTAGATPKDGHAGTLYPLPP